MPTCGRVVVVSTGVDNPLVAVIVMRQERIQRTIEGKMQYLHAGKFKVVAQLIYVRSDFAQILGDKG